MAYKPELSKHKITFKAIGDNVCYETIIKQERKILSTSESVPSGRDEIACIVFSVGEDVTKVKVGDSIIPDIIFAKGLHNSKEGDKNIILSTVRESNVLCIVE